MSSFGKLVADDLYIHLDALEYLHDNTHRDQIVAALARVSAHPDRVPNVAKLNQRTGKLSLLSYPCFDTEPFPELVCCWTFSEREENEPSFRSYENSINPPILHRKELLVAPNHPKRCQWAELTTNAESLGLFDDPSTIGFRLNWDRLVHSKGYAISDDGIVPIGNLELSPAADNVINLEREEIQRHLTALSRSSLSAPIQLLIRHQLLSTETTLFDYGCGRGDDIRYLVAEGFRAAGWDPYYAPENSRTSADVVNLGFVVNVIEDPAERIEAIHQAFSLATGVLAVSVMLHRASHQTTSHVDGVLTSRNTFQKYFSQGELKDFLELVLNRPVYMVGPGVAFIFASNEWEQRFCTGRYQSRGIAQRLLMARISRPIKHGNHTNSRQSVSRRLSRAETQFLEIKPFLDKLWRLALELGRFPDPTELTVLGALPEVCPSPNVCKRLIEQHYDLSLLRAAAATRTDDLRVFFAAQQFEKRPAYKQLSPRLQTDIKTFFGDYRAAQASGLILLRQTSNPEQILEAAQKASEQGTGWLENNHSLQLHVDLIDRLPAVLRAYVSCGLLLWDSLGEVDLVKIHVHSGKLTLLEFDDFESSPLPLLRRRIKINIRKLDYDVFEYGTPAFPKPYLFFKSRYMHEDLDGYAAQSAFDDALQVSGVVAEDGPMPNSNELLHKLELSRLKVDGMRLSSATTIPPLDQQCGSNFTYRSFVECGETQNRLKLANLPVSPQTYNAIHALAVQILDPIIDYFGAIRLTYGFCSHELSKHISSRVAHHLDQHVSFERNSAGKRICTRGGAACDFIVDDEDMAAVADWIIEFLPFDRMYFYGSDKPLHISYSDKGEKKAYRMVLSDGGRLMPRPYSSPNRLTAL